MPTHESVCFTEIRQLWKKVKEQGPETQISSSITEHPGFQSICLDVWVLQMAYCAYRQQTAKTLRETKVFVNADLSYLCLTALAVVPILYDILMNCFPSSPKHFHR